MAENHMKEEEDLQCQTLVWNHILAGMDSMVLKCAIKLRLFDTIHSHGTNPPITLTELACSLSQSSNRPTILHRIMRYLAHMRLINIHHDTIGESYTLTTASSIYLREGSEKSLSAFARFHIAQDMYEIMLALDTCFVDMLPIQSVRGDKFYEWAKRDPVVSKLFYDAMACSMQSTVETVLKGYPAVFEGVRTLVDVGGGSGIFATSIAKAFPWIKCIIFDLPHVVKEAPEREGVVYEAGDMFVSVPHADAMLLMRILLGWNDEKALEILKRCKEAIVEDNGKLIIVDVLIDENDSEDVQHVKLVYDILMMALVGGKGRTEKEWRSLLLQAGFSRCTITPIMALQHVIEAIP